MSWPEVGPGKTLGKALAPNEANGLGEASATPGRGIGTIGGIGAAEGPARGVGEAPGQGEGGPGAPPNGDA